MIVKKVYQISLIQNDVDTLLSSLTFKKELINDIAINLINKKIDDIYYYELDNLLSLDLIDLDKLIKKIENINNAWIEISCGRYAILVELVDIIDKL